MARDTEASISPIHWKVGQFFIAVQSLHNELQAVQIRYYESGPEVDLLFDVLFDMAELQRHRNLLEDYLHSQQIHGLFRVGCELFQKAKQSVDELEQSVIQYEFSKAMQKLRDRCRILTADFNNLSTFQLYLVVLFDRQRAAVNDTPLLATQFLCKLEFNTPTHILTPFGSKHQYLDQTLACAVNAIAVADIHMAEYALNVGEMTASEIDQYLSRLHSAVLEAGKPTVLSSTDTEAATTASEERWNSYMDD